MRLRPLIFFLFFTLLGCQDQLAKLNPMDNFSSAFQPKSRPGISLVGANPLVLNVGEEFIDPGVKALSVDGKDLSAKVVATHFIDKSKVGEYFVRYNVSDSGAAATELIRVVLVTPPNNVSVVRYPHQGDSPYEYLDYVPSSYHQSSESYPLVIFLHAIGESGGVDFSTGVRSGKPLESVLMNGPLKLAKLGKDFPAIVVHPQSVSWWSPAKIKQYLDFLKTKYRINPKKVYLTGASMGGAGAWEFARTYPNEVAAIVPVCGASMISGLSEAQNLVNIPFWAFHAKGDPVVSVEYSYSYLNLTYQAITAKTDRVQDYYSIHTATTKTVALENKLNLIVYAGINKGVSQDKLLTIYPHNFHDSWSETYQNQLMWEWLWSKSRP